MSTSENEPPNPSSRAPGATPEPHAIGAERLEGEGEGEGEAASTASPDHEGWPPRGPAWEHGALESGEALDRQRRRRRREALCALLREGDEE